MSTTAAPRSTGNIPADVTSFVGRRREVGEVKRLLSLSRLVTLTGVGGVGKTRLALRVARDLRREYPDGAWFVEIAALDDQALLTQALAGTLGLQDRSARWPVTALTDYLQDKRLLLILDNCDHLRDGCAVLTDALLRHAPSLRILTTSRQTLGVTGEHVFQVPPLTLPLEESEVRADAAAQYEGVNLFVERAKAVRPTFELNDQTVRAATAVCRRVDGIPLAIELAAARLSALSVQDLLDRLEDRYQLLVSGSTSADPRHQTLRALIDWSWDLCSDAERTLWARISVFAAGFDLPAAEAVCADDLLERHAILDLLTALVEKSIVTAQEEDGRIRYRMLETLRQFSQARLAESGQQEALRQTHRSYYSDLVSTARAEWFGPHQKKWLDRLRIEHSNIRVALETSFDGDHVGTGIHLVSNLWFFWIATGYTNEARRWLDRGLRSTSTPAPEHTLAVEMGAYMCILQEDLATAKPMIAVAQREAAEHGDARNQAWARQLAAMSVMGEGDLAEAEPLLADALEAHRANDDLLGLLDTYFYLVTVNALMNNLDRAELLCDAAIAICDSHGERWFKAYLLWDYGLVAWQRGETNAATKRVRSALELAQQLGDTWSIAFCLEFLAWTAEATGDRDRAARLLGSAEGVWRRMGWRGAGVPHHGMRDLTEYHHRCLSRLRDQLGAPKLELAMHSGAAMAWDQAVAQALGGSPATAPGRQEGSSALPSLTRRENEVAELVAQGLSNKEIAARLVISQRTAEAHVERILTKLGFTSRAQVAAWVVEHRGSVAR